MGPGLPKGNLFIQSQADCATIVAVRSYLKQLLDQKSGILLTITCLAVVALFIIIAQPFKQPAIQHPAALQPTADSLTTIKGQATIVCPLTTCDKSTLESAYDIVLLHGSDTSTPVAQTPMTSGRFEFLVPAGTYTIRTIPANPTATATVTTDARHASTVNLKITVDKTK